MIEHVRQGSKVSRAQYRMNAVQFLRLLRMACWAFMQLAVTPAVFGVLWIAMAGCAGGGWGRPGECPSGPARTACGAEPELAHVKIEVERLSVSAEINGAGEFTDGLDDDPFWYRVCLPECPPLELREDVAARCFLEFVPAPGGTEVRFRGFFLDGVSVLKTLGFRTLTVTPSIDAPAPDTTGLANDVLRPPWTLDISGPTLIVNGIQLARLPEVAASAAPVPAPQRFPGQERQPAVLGEDVLCEEVTIPRPDLKAPGLHAELLRPAPNIKPVGGVVCLFGTAFLRPDPEWASGWPRALAAHGYLALCPEYRCAGQQIVYSDTLEDVYISVRWMQDRAAALGIRPDQVSLLGYSAGALLAGLCGYATPEALGLAPQLHPDCPLHSVIILAGAPSLLPADGQVDGRDARCAMTARWTHSWDADLFRQLSMDTWVRAPGPPLLVLHHEADGVMPVAAWHERISSWKKQGVACRLTILTDKQAQPIRAHYLLHTPEDATALGEVVNWLQGPSVPPGEGAEPAWR